MLDLWAPIEWNQPDDDENKLYRVITTMNEGTRETNQYIVGEAAPGEEFNYSDLNGSAGAPFRSADEAAFPWSPENVPYAENWQNERAGTIYSQDNGPKGKTQPLQTL